MAVNRREQLYQRLKDIFVTFRSSMQSNFDAAVSSEKGVDSCRFDLKEETIRGGTYFRPMSRERLASLIKRPDMPAMDFDAGISYPWSSNADMVEDAINGQLRFSKEYNDMWTAYGTTQWEPIATCCDFEEGLHEYDSDYYSGGQDPTGQTRWSLHDIWGTTSGPPHRSCIASHEILDVDGPTRSELMILTGLMIAGMRHMGLAEQEVFPVLMFSIHGHKARLIEAYMSLKEERLKVRYSELFDFRHLTQEWLDIFVRWMLNDPLLEPDLPVDVGSAKKITRSGEFFAISGS